MRALRRGLCRAEGFALFVAVCNSPADRDRWIDLLADSLPGRQLLVVRLTASTFDPLDEVLAQITPDGRSPIMLVDAEKAVLSAQPDHPVLYALNLRREEWRSLKCPVVFWVPDYLLGLLGREAPDFLDWRSGTLFFPSFIPGEMEVLSSQPWMGGADGRMPELERRARMAELESRIAAHRDSQDPVVAATVAVWLNELGNHLALVGNLEEAERAFREALQLSERLGRVEDIAAAYGNLGVVYFTRGDLGLAEQMHHRALELVERLGRQEGMANHYSNLGVVYLTRGDLEQAERVFRRALELNERVGRLMGVASAYCNLGVVYMTRGDLEQAERMLRRALELNERVGRLEGMADAYGNLGLVYRKRGDLEQAEQMHRRALELDVRLGRQQGMADDYGNLGVIYGTRGDLEQAEQMFHRALELNERVGRLEGMADAYGNLGLVYLNRGNVMRARELGRKALELFTKLGASDRIKQAQEWLDRLPAQTAES